MIFVRHVHGGQASALSLCQTVCLWVPWIQATIAMAQGEIASDGSIASQTAIFGLIPSAPVLIPSAPTTPKPSLPGLIPSQAPPALIPSRPPTDPVPSQPHGLIPSQSPPGLIPSQPPPVLIPSAPVTSTQAPGLIPSGPISAGPIPSGVIPTGPAIIPSLTDIGSGIIPSGSPQPSASNVAGGPTASMQSTEEGLRPIPPAATSPGNPNGHHEVSEPNFTRTASCKGCSPVIEVPATGFFDWPSTPIPEEAGPTTTEPPNKATITAGPKPIIITRDPSSSGQFIVGGSTTITVGQTITVDKTPVVIQTSSDRTEIIIDGTSTVPFAPTSIDEPESQVTEGPILAPVTIGDHTVTANSQSQYVLLGQTLQPGGPAITVDGTTVSLAPSASAIVINGQTSTLAQIYGAIYTTTTSPLLTVNNEVFTANRAGFYVLAPGTTLIPGGPAVTVSGTTISLEPYGTMAVIQGSTSLLTPVTTMVTLTRGGGGGGGVGGGGAGGGSGDNRWPSHTSGEGLDPASPTGSHVLGSGAKLSAQFAGDGLFGGAFVLAAFAISWLALWL